MLFEVKQNEEKTSKFSNKMIKDRSLEIMLIDKELNRYERENRE